MELGQIIGQQLDSSRCRLQRILRFEGDIPTARIQGAVWRRPPSRTYLRRQKGQRGGHGASPAILRDVGKKLPRPGGKGDDLGLEHLVSRPQINTYLSDQRFAGVGPLEGLAQSSL